MALRKNRSLRVERVYAFKADLSTAGSAFTVSPVSGKVILLGCVTHVKVETAPNVLTAEIGVSGAAGVAITHPAWAQSHVPDISGVVVEVIPSAANTIVAGNNIEFKTDGTGDGTVPTTFYADILVG